VAANPQKVSGRGAVRTSRSRSTSRATTTSTRAHAEHQRRWFVHREAPPASDRRPHHAEVPDPRHRGLTRLSRGPRFAGSVRTRRCAGGWRQRAGGVGHQPSLPKARCRAIQKVPGERDSLYYDDEDEGAKGLRPSRGPPHASRNVDGSGSFSHGAEENAILRVTARSVAWLCHA